MDPRLETRRSNDLGGMYN
nr:hypothetical protein [Tanacetum cinerariifolium]